ncbi:MAG TPA: hypothetical protein VFR64_00675 [Methylomirabilota bacterium]|nr:hypothetical protein [Methylomirabilota bacterium]
MRQIVWCLIAVAAWFAWPVPAFAQTPPAAPAPKVTINGLIDFVSSLYHNLSDFDITGAAPIPGAHGRDNGWYSRERGIFTVTGEVGRSKGVLSLEMDFANGRIDTLTAAPSGNNGFDLEADEKGQIEVKWLYLEAPITGSDSLLPFVPMPTVGRFGAQPARGHDFKPGIQFSGDFPGATFETGWAQNIRSVLTYAQIDEQLDGVLNPVGTEDFAFVGSLLVSLSKELTVKPTYSYVRFDRGSGTPAAFGTEPKGGFSPAAASQANKATVRHTLGGDLRWVFGPWSLQPTFLYQFGEQETVAATAGGKNEVDISSWIFDVIGGFRSGPLTIEVRGMYTPGNEATECVQTVAGVCAGGSDINYYQAINPGTILYFAGWSEIESAGVDYQLPFQGGAVTGMKLGANPSYDKYGRIVAAVAMDYAVTPAFITHFVTLAQWTAEEVDTDGALINPLSPASLVAQTNGITPASGGDERYLGTEVNGGFTYRFTANTSFDLIGAYLFAGPARDSAQIVGGPSRDAKDVYKVSARMRVTF